ASLYLGEMQENENLVFYVKQKNDLLYNAAFKGGETLSSRLQALASAAKKMEYSIDDLYLVLKDKLENATDIASQGGAAESAILRDETAVAILTTMAFYGGVQFHPLNNFSEAFYSVTSKLRHKSKFQANNFIIHNAFEGLLDAGIIAQGTLEGIPIIYGTAKLDTYLRRNFPISQ
ncbi:MAG: hypothetical protein QF798_02895, partial [Candidatus Woesearchaeota archaeon]|nr:hypothetical protein [Candidatus Woesearchaeota archaeon]